MVIFDGDDLLFLDASAGEISLPVSEFQAFARAFLVDERLHKPTRFSSPPTSKRRFLAAELH